MSEEKKPSPRLRRSVKSAEKKSAPASQTTSAKRGSVPRATKAGTARKGKYNAAGERVDGIWFASGAEARRYEQLKVMRDNGLIDNLRLQVSMPCKVNNILICTYRTDFNYDVIDDRGYVVRSVIEDVKGMVTDIYRIKKKLVEAIHLVEIQEIPARDVLKWIDKIP